MLLDFMNPKNGGVMYKDIYSQLVDAVKSGALKKGDKLPSIREAAAQLGVSRTTVENAYMRLCIEGIAESRPQRGYFICGTDFAPAESGNIKTEEYKYDFSSQKIDPESADISLWRKTVRRILNDSEQLVSYGDPQGEYTLRQALSEYSYKARGVRASAESIVIGAGVGPLLNILCGILKKDALVGMENGLFMQALQIFSDYSIPCAVPESDRNGAVVKSLAENGVNVLFLQPSALPKVSASGINRRRAEFSRWVREENDRLIIEDDYNGELRYTARSISSFQGKEPENTVYIGSFSKLLLPSVRIAYMVLPPRLLSEYNKRKKYYNQTCGKAEQLALCDYIITGALEKHLRRLRKLYNGKSRLLCESLEKKLGCFSSLNLYETSLTVEVRTKLKANSEDICKTAEKCGIKLIKSENSGCFRMCFGGIKTDLIPPAVAALNNCLGNVGVTGLD